jgi:hypothetical protein
MKWLIVGLGIAALLVSMIVIGTLNQGGDSPPPPRIAVRQDDGLAAAQARWDGSDPLQREATCASWRSYSHDEFFSLNPVPIEGRPLMTTLLNRNC